MLPEYIYFSLPGGTKCLGFSDYADFAPASSPSGEADCVWVKPIYAFTVSNPDSFESREIDGERMYDLKSLHGSTGVRVQTEREISERIRRLDPLAQLDPYTHLLAVPRQTISRRWLAQPLRSCTQIPPA